MAYGVCGMETGDIRMEKRIKVGSSRLRVMDGRTFGTSKRLAFISTTMSTKHRNTNRQAGEREPLIEPHCDRHAHTA